MKLQEFKQLIREELRKVIAEKRRINENRVPFRGTTADDLYRIVKNKPNAIVVVNGMQYSVDVDDIADNLSSELTYVLDDSGRSKEVAISDIKFIEL